MISIFSTQNKLRTSGSILDYFKVVLSESIGVCWTYAIIISIILMAMDIKNSVPVVKAAIRNFFLLMTKLLGKEFDEASCAIARRMMASTASSKVRSEKVKGGSCMLYTNGVWLGKR